MNIFRFLQELGYAHLLYKPNKADYALYWKKDCIVVTDMISEAPLSASAPHEICLEKMLVDMYCDKLISSAYSKSEYPEVLKQAMETYHIESTKMMRYARRRGREDKSVLMQNRVFRFLMQFSENLITVANFGNAW